MTSASGPAGASLSSAPGTGSMSVVATGPEPAWRGSGALSRSGHEEADPTDGGTDRLGAPLSRSVTVRGAAGSTTRLLLTRCACRQVGAVPGAGPAGAATSPGRRRARQRRGRLGVADPACIDTRPTTP